MNIVGHKGDDVLIRFEARKIKPDKCYKLSIFCGVNNFTRKKFFMAMLAFEDDSHFELEAEIGILRFSTKD